MLQFLCAPENDSSVVTRTARKKSIGTRLGAKAALKMTSGLSGDRFQPEAG
jgi:hypothetical protein